MSKRNTISSSLVAVMLIGLTSIGAQGELAAQRPQTDVRMAMIVLRGRER